jgi:type I restriction system specificity protein
LIIAATSENDEDLCMAVAWLGKEEIAVGSDACFYSHNMEPKYVACYFQSESFQKQKRSYNTGTKVKRVSANDLALPQEQKEIFTDLLLMEEAKAMTEKIEAAPTLKEFLLKENLATSRVIEREGLSKLQVGTITSGLRNAEEIIPVSEKEKFFNMLSKEIKKELSGDVPQTRSFSKVGISFNYLKIPVDRVKKAWCRS